MSSIFGIAPVLALAIAAAPAFAENPVAKQTNPGARAAAHAYPTVDRVEFVLECMQKNGGKQEFLYKCACEIDQIAERVAYDDYVEASTAARYQSLAGDRGSEFRDPPEVKLSAKRYLQIRTDAMKHCDVPR